MSKSKLNAWKSTPTVIHSVWSGLSVSKCVKMICKKLAKQISWWDCVIPRVRLPGPASCPTLVTAVVTIVTQEADNENHPVCCHCLRYQRVSAPPPEPPGVLTGHRWAPHHTCDQTWVMSPEECLQLQESVTSMQIRLKMSRYPGTSRYLHNPGNHQSLSSIIKIVSHKQELYYWSEQKSWPCHWMT